MYISFANSFDILIPPDDKHVPIIVPAGADYFIEDQRTSSI